MVSRPADPDGNRVATLTTLAGWRQFASEMPAIPELLASRVWKGLDEDKRAAYDDDRIAHHSRLLVVQTPAVRDVVTTGRRLAYMNRSAPYGRSARRSYVGVSLRDEQIQPRVKAQLLSDETDPALR